MRFFTYLLSLFLLSCSGTPAENNAWTRNIANTSWEDSSTSRVVSFDASGRTMRMSDYQEGGFILNTTLSPTCAIYRSEFFIQPPKWFLLSVEPVNNITNLILFGSFIEPYEINRDNFLQTNYIRTP